MRLLVLLLSGILLATSVDARPASGFYTNPEIDELRIEMDDLKAQLHATTIELNLLDENVKKQNAGRAKDSTLVLEKRITGLEKTLDKLTQDIRTLSKSLTDSLTKIHLFEQTLTSQDKRLDEVSKLKTTLTSISKAIGTQTAEISQSKTHLVKAGDTLEKIARLHHVAIESLKETNKLKTDKIVIGQELRIP